ncbi:putative Uncharacterized transporter C3H1.06c [Glarea lozoyensis 74030]|uniref:Putative Uncharacterized transporter C3H1.06c n=1 Tax=Glarea lozoyensis (strain ATCC 74030 / MF5533) TaxID=1104152 RepID=H0EGP1_GLAL7|nr:putative Uncharacterized transporter C3H1.06c [Glarea lozoyensis 74030]
MDGANRTGDASGPVESSQNNNPPIPHDSSSSTLHDASSSDSPTPPIVAKENASPSSDPEATRTTLQTAIIMISLCSSVFLAALDTTIVTTALPTISEHFHSNAGYTWIGSAYLLANAASTPSWGKFSDIWGRKPILLIAAGIFFIGIWDGLKAVDWAGSLAIVGGTLMLLLGLEFGGITYPWGSATVICLIVFGVVTAFLFILNEWKFARYPVMPMRLFNHPSNFAALGTCFFHGYVFIAGTYYLPLYFQAVLGATPLLSGVYLLPLALSLSFVSAASGIFIKKTGRYLPPIWFGMIFMTLGFGLLIDLDVRANWAKIIIFQIIAGIGVGPNFQAPLIALQNFVAPRDIAAATSTFGFVRNLSTSISVVIGGVVFQNEMQKKLAVLSASLGPETAASLSGGSAGASVGIVNALPMAQREVARLAFHQSLKTMWIIHKALEKGHQVTKTGLAEEEKKRRELKGGKKVVDEEKGGAEGGRLSGENGVVKEG